MPHNNPDLADIIHAAIEEAAKLRAYDPKHDLLRYIGSADKTDVWEAFLDRFARPGLSHEARNGYEEIAHAYENYISALRKASEEFDPQDRVVYAAV